MYFCALENEILIIIDSMMKKLTNSRALLILLVLVVCFVLPMKAQNCDGFFHNDELYNDRNGTIGGYNIGTQGFGSDVYGGFNITTQHFGQEAPLGSGLLIMLGAGTVYAVKKHKRKGGFLAALGMTNKE